MGTQTLVDRNPEFARRFDQGGLTIPPRESTLIVTCLDARVDPAHFLGLELGDAFVIRNVGGRITEEVVEQVAVLLALAVAAGGSPFEVAVIHHTDCGTARFTDPDLRRRLAVAARISVSAVEALATTDPRVSVRRDLDRLRAAQALPDDLVVAGYVYDVTNGLLETVSEPGLLRLDEA